MTGKESRVFIEPVEAGGIEAGAAPAPRPPLAFRVGVTGSRHLKAEEIEALRAPVAAVLRQVRDTLVELACDDAAKAVYRHQLNEAPIPHLRLLSPLAVGADRLVAEEAVRPHKTARGLDLPYKLLVPMPFAQDEYEKDFPDSVSAFRHLLAQAKDDVLALDGGRGTDESASYEAVGRFVARNCDVLVAIWDGVSEDKRGSAGQIVRFAARESVPVWWIDIASGAATWIARPSHLRHRGPAPRGEAAATALATYMKAVVLPPKASHPLRHGVMGWAAHHVRRFRGFEAAPVAVYLQEPDRLPKGLLWEAYDATKNRLASVPRRDVTFVAEPPATPVEDWWKPFYERPDALSVDYGNRYRSSYVLVIALAFCAVTAAALGGYLKDTSVAATPTLVELALLIAIGALVFANHVQCWQERWITYRLLAELCRKQTVLAIIGRSLPGAEVTRSAAGAAAIHRVSERVTGHRPLRRPPLTPTGLAVLRVMTRPRRRLHGGHTGETDVAAREVWVGWYFLACLRAAPLPTGDIRSATPRALAVGTNLVLGQGAYHKRRAIESNKAEHRLSGTGEWFFLLTALGLFGRLFFFTEGANLDIGEWIETIAVLLSGVSAAFVALRAYSEFALLARKSAQMEEIMTEARADLADMTPNLPLASGELGFVLHRIAMAMLQEVGGWAQLFRLKSVEPG